ncbi:MAG: response regulator [Clostridiales bacterium]|nr:response regulator [Clostridiales bacterium]
MYRLLIVDDEPIIVDGLYDLFSNLRDIKLEIYRAYSSIEALDCMRKIKIDIVLCDISMPIMSGLELQREIKLQWPKCRIIFLTGFNEFDYIQEAIRNGSVDYVLKTEGDEAIIEAVKKAVKQIEEEVKADELIKKAKLNMFKALPVLQKKYLMDLLEGVSTWNPERDKIQFSELSIPLQAGEAIMLMISRIDNLDVNSNITEKMKAVYGIQSIADEYLSQMVNYISVIYDRTKLLWIIQPKTTDTGNSISDDADTSQNRTRLFVQGTMESIQKKCKEVLGVSASFAASGDYFCWNDVAEKFYSLNQSLNKSAGLEDELLIIDHIDPQEESSSESKEEYYIKYKLKKVSLLETYLESGQKKEFNELLKLMFKEIRNYTKISDGLYKEVYYSVAMVFLSHINRLNLEEKLRPNVDVDSLLNFNCKMDWEEMYGYFLRISELIFQRKKEDYEIHNSKIIEHIKKYIEENLDGDLSLTKFSEMLHFNPSYLSRIYKQLTGESISEYIAEVKFNKAREMLKDTSLKINEIAFALGFETPSYFTRFFKKKANLSPQEYRDSAV